MNNGYFGSEQHLEDVEYSDDWWKIGDSLAKDIGYWFWIKHLVRSRIKRFLFVVRYRFKRL